MAVADGSRRPAAVADGRGRGRRGGGAAENLAIAARSLFLSFFCSMQEKKRGRGQGKDGAVWDFLGWHWVAVFS